MAITSTCTGCGKTLAVADEFAGRQARCPECGTIYSVPMASSAALAAPLPSLQPVDPNPTPFANNSPAPIEPAGSSEAVQYWMRAANGTEYGPTDAATLARWFNEGRVGQNYQIRRGTDGDWQPASMFSPATTNYPTNSNAGNSATPAYGTAASPQSANPYAPQANFAASNSMPYRSYPKSDQSGLVLAMGILAWLGACPIFGIIAWVVGAQALADIRSGQSDPTNRGLVLVGYYMGMVNVLIMVACVGLFFLGIALGSM